MEGEKLKQLQRGGHVLEQDQSFMQGKSCFGVELAFDIQPAFSGDRALTIYLSMHSYGSSNAQYIYHIHIKVAPRMYSI